MKDRAALEAIAREIVDSFEKANRVVTVGLLDRITEALARVQDEAVNSVLPSEEDFLMAAWDEKRDNFTDSKKLYDWLRANMKAPDEK